MQTKIVYPPPIRDVDAPTGTANINGRRGIIVLTDRVLLDIAYGVTLSLAACSCAGIVLSIIQTALSVHLFRKASSVSRPSKKTHPGSHTTTHDVPNGDVLVSILKPVSGLEDGLKENLESFADLRGVRYELIVSIADPADPAVPVVKRVLECFPEGQARLVIGREIRTANPKVERLIAAVAYARGDIFFISDSNVRVSPEDIAKTVREFDDPRVGCVSNPFIAEGARSLGALVESLYLLIFVLPGNVLAAWFGVPCVVGKSMAITRRLCDALGGFEAFGQLLAEDQSIAVATKKAGYKVVLSPVVVRNVIERRSVGQVIQRQVRWGKMRYSFSKFLYSAELLANPLPLIVLACVSSMIFLPRYLGMLMTAASLVLAVRLCQSLVLMYASGAKVSKLAAVLVPTQDFVQAAAQIAPYISKEVNWRGFRTRLGPNSLILAADPRTASREYAPAILSSTWQS